MQPAFRFAPSPNGPLHLGHAYSALLNANLARAFEGRFLLRIEDIDIARCRPEFEAAIYHDLAWLGLEWEQPVRRQSEHFDDYHAALSRLKEQGLVYPCFCSRKEITETIARSDGIIARRDPDGALLYPGTCKKLSAQEISRRCARNEPFAWRINMELACAQFSGRLPYLSFSSTGTAEQRHAVPARWGDAVIARKEVPTSYHLSVVVDDALQNITHVVRGADLEAATDLHVLLQTLLALPTPQYHHHHLLRDEHGEKLAKSRLSQSLSDLRSQGVQPNQLRRQLGL